MLAYQLQESPAEVRREFVVHSTSWRYTLPPGQVIVTYIAYSDELEFGKRNVKYLTLNELRKIDIPRTKPRSQNGLERLVVAHAMRHMAFLIKTDSTNEFKNAFASGTRKVFKSLWISLAGRLVF